MAVLFDTRAFHRTLTDAGVLPAIADAHTRAVEAALEGGVATKQDIREVRQEVQESRREAKQDTLEVRQEIQLVRRDIEIQSRDLKLWFGSALVVLLGLLLAGRRLFWK